jgi:hypothetical protein
MVSLLSQSRKGREMAQQSSDVESNKDLPSQEELKHRIAELYEIKNILLENYNIVKLIDERIKNFEDALALIEKADQGKESLDWVSTNGPKGPYELLKPCSNPQYLTLLKELQDHQGKLTKEGYFLWLFMDGALGRKMVK